MPSKLLLLSGLLVTPLAAQSQGLKLANGTVNYIDVPYSPVLMPKSGITIEAWVTYDSSTSASRACRTASAHGRARSPAASRT